jgi:WD40 repeat protein
VPHDAAISPDGRQVVCVGQDLRVTLIDPMTGKERFRLGEQLQEFPALAFSPDGRTLAVGEKDGTLRLWETATGRQRLAPAQHGGRIWSLAFAPDGRRLACASGDTTVLIWDLPRRAGVDATVTLTKQRLKSLLADLDQDDAKRAYQAIWELASEPVDSVGLLRDALRSGVADATRIHELITALDDEDFEAREKASQDLAALGKTVETELRQALDRSSSPEVKDRVAKLLKRLEGGTGGNSVSPRWGRAVEVLELIDSPAARQVLRTWARGPETSPTAAEARAALERLQKDR